MSEMAPRFTAFCNFLRITTKTLSKKIQKLKIRAHLMQNFMEHDMKKLLDPKALTFGVWSLKTSLGQFGPKAFGKRLIKPLFENPSSNFHKQGLIFSRILRWIQWNHEISKTFLTLWPGTNKLHFGHLGPEDDSAISPEP